MRKKLSLLITSLVLLFATGFVGMLAPLSASASPASDACAGLNAASGTPSGNCTNSAAATNSFGSIIRTVINILSIVVGAVAVVMLIIGGLRYVVSGGDSNGVSGAKNTILYAIVGLVIVLFAQVIVRFVLTKTQGR